MEKLKRRSASFTGVFVAAVVLAALLPIWLPIAVLLDLARLRWRLPIARLLMFALGWAWLESAGVALGTGLWIIGQGKHEGRHYRLQRWWAAHLIGWLRLTTGWRVEVRDVDALTPGPTVLLCRHASLADSLVSAWVITTLAAKQPRYVLKRELLADPCLDLVGNRVPNHFLDRGAADSAAELAALTQLATGMGERDVAVIFPEGTRSSPAKRSRALERIGERDPERALRLSALNHLLPPRPAGAAALLDGCPTADVVVAWHVGFDGLDTFGGILRHLSTKPIPIQFVAQRVDRSLVPTGDEFVGWLDGTWLQADQAVAALIAASVPEPRPHDPHPQGAT